MSSTRGHPRQGTRDKGEPAIIEALEFVGAVPWKIDEPCDLIVGYLGRNYLLEVKDPPGKRGGTGREGQHLSPAQLRFSHAWAGKGHFAVVTDEREALLAIGIDRLLVDRKLSALTRARLVKESRRVRRS